MAYYISANINKCWQLGACRGAPEAAASDEQRVCRPASVEVQRAPGLGWGGSVWEPDVQISNGWCKVPIPAGWRAGKALKQGIGGS